MPCDSKHHEWKEEARGKDAVDLVCVCGAAASAEQRSDGWVVITILQPRPALPLSKAPATANCGHELVLCRSCTMQAKTVDRAAMYNCYKCCGCQREPASTVPVLLEGKIPNLDRHQLGEIARDAYDLKWPPFEPPF